MEPQRHVSERTVVFLVGAVQFVNILDFMMVMPLGPDFARQLGIPLSHLGFIGGSYTAAAGLAGIAGSFFLDRFERRAALAVCMTGLVLGTMAGALATGMWSLLATRVVAGMFGGPATAVAGSIIADVVPPERRGRAMGAVMMAFSLASVFGVPAGLWLAEHGGWQTPFLAVGGAGAVLTAVAVRALPRLRGHLDAAAKAPPRAYLDLFTHPLVLRSYGLTTVVMMAGFILVPNISAYVQYNLGYPRDDLKYLYLFGGSVSLVSMRAVGRMVDRVGATRTGALGSVALTGVVFAGFGMEPSPLPVMGIFMLFMLCMSFRNVSYNALASRVPRAHERAQFMSLQSAVQHFASACAAFLSTTLLTEGVGHRLEGMPRLAAVSIILSLVVPVMMAVVERGVRAREATATVPDLGPGRIAEPV